MTFSKGMPSCYKSYCFIIHSHPLKVSLTSFADNKGSGFTMSFWISYKAHLCSCKWFLNLLFIVSSLMEVILISFPSKYLLWFPNIFSATTKSNGLKSQILVQFPVSIKGLPKIFYFHISFNWPK